VNTSQITAENTTPARLFIKSDFTPTKANDHIELEINNFARDYTKFFNTHINPTRNLTFYQEHALEELQADPRFRIVPTDKNLGPSILEIMRYKQAIIDEHLLSASFKQIIKEEVNEIINISREKAYELTIEGAKLSAGEFVFLERAFKQPWRMAQLYGLPKIHKTPMKFRPIESQTNGPIEFCSLFVDSELQPILQSAPGYIIDSAHCQDDLERLDLPPNARLFTADAISMYSNIDLNLGIASIRQWLEEEKTTPQDRIELTISLLTLVMRCNVFQFEDTFWVQLIGTAMGTSCAVTFATICFLLTERRIRTKFSHRLPFFKRFIDGILGIWLVDNTITNHEEDEDWLDFKRELNNFGRLRWAVSKLTNKSVFLDLDITLEPKGRFSFQTYQKELNLHLYIPAASAHPPGTLKGTIFGNLQRYWRQNTKQTDYVNITKSFGIHLYNSGHNIANIVSLFKEAAKLIEHKQSLTGMATCQSNTIHSAHTIEKQRLFLHAEFHPRGIPRRTIRQLYNRTLAKTNLFDHFIVAYHRPINLRDLLSKTKLQSSPSVPSASKLVSSRRLVSNSQKMLTPNPPCTAPYNSHRT
jgi:hypothetical protein